MFLAASALRMPLNHVVTLSESVLILRGNFDNNCTQLIVYPELHDIVCEMDLSLRSSTLFSIITSIFTSLEFGCVTRLLALRIYLSNYF